MIENETPRAERLAFGPGGIPAWLGWYRARLGEWRCEHSHCSQALAIQCAREHAAAVAKAVAA